MQHSMLTKLTTQTSWFIGHATPPSAGAFTLSLYVNYVATVTRVDCQCTRQSSLICHIDVAIVGRL